MTIDKMKHYMGEELFNHWASVADRGIIAKAIKALEQEMKKGILTGVRYQAELEFLKYRLGA